MKFSPKRILSFILALGMILAMVPELGIKADAATTISGVSVTGLEATYVHSTPTSTLGTDGTTSCTGGTNNITATASSAKSSFLTGGKVTQATVTITLKNTQFDNAELSFHYNLSGTGANLSSSITASTGADADYKVTLKKNESVTIKLTSNSGGTQKATLAITNIKLLEKIIVKTTFLPADPTTGSYTVGGTQITAQTEKEQEATSPYAVIATPATGYRFVGWYSETTGEYLSFDATTDLYVGSAMSVKPIFESDVDAVFGVGTRRFNDLKAAAGYAGVASTKQINLLKNATVPAGNYTIPTGVTLLIPFDSANTLYTAEPSNAGRITEESTGNKVPFWETPFCYRTLTLASGASIKVDGAISVSAKHTLGHGSKPYGGSVSGAYGQIAMQGTSSITVASGGALYAWGYITGSGSVTAQSGAKVYEYFQIADFRGGTVTSDMIDGRKTYKVFPFSQFYVQNIEVPLTLHAGSEELLYSGLHMADTEVPFEIKFIGTASNESLFRLSDGASMTKRYNPTTEQMTYELSGNITMSNLKLGFDKLSWAVQAIISGYLGSSAINSSEFVFPVTNNLSINVNSGTLTINQDVALLPGSSVTVASGATVNMYSGKSFIVYDRDEWMSDTFVHSTGPVYFQPAIYTPARGLTSSRTTDSLVDAKVEINGTLQMDGNAYTTAGGANITSTGGGIIVFKNAPDTTKTVAYEYSQVSTNGGFKSLTVTPAKLYNSASVTDKTVPTYTETANDTAAGDAYVWKNGKWEKVTAKISFVKSIDNFDPDGTEITGSIADATVSGYVIIDGTGYDYTLPDSTGFTAANYDFAGWSEKSDGSGIILAAGDKVKIKGDTTYYATWTPKEYTVSFNAGEGVTVAPIIGKYQTQITAPTPTKNGCTLSGWAKEGTDTVMYKPGDKITVTGDETLYAIWEVQKCTITWVNDDGSNLASVQVENGNAFPAYPKDTEPAKAGDAQYSYVFAGWSIDNDKTVDELPATVTGDVTLKAVYTPVVNKYTVTWKDWNGTEIGSETVEYGTYLARLQPANPSRPEDAAATYGFAGWDADGNGTADTLPETVTGDVTYTATYTAYKKSYTITWVVNGATTTRSVDHGEIPVYPDAEPSKAADAQYTYTFAGWDADGDEDVDVQPDGAFPAVSGAATYTAVFDKTVNQYTITWKDGDGSILKEEKLNYGATPKYVGATPTKTSDGQYSYEWDGGWSPVIASVTKDADYQATFEKTTRTYTVIWQNEDGTELEKDTGVEYGADPSYDGAEPAKEGNAQYTYTFAGWDPAVDKVKSDVTYKATYTPETNKYTVTWKDWDGTVLETDENVPYGTQPEFNKTKEPSRAANAQYTYHWTGGWTTEVETVKGDVVYTAAYTSVVNKYTITWLDDDGTPAFEPTEVAYGEMPSCPDPVKEEDAQYTYVFAGWTPALKPVDGDATYTATYTHTVKEYQIQFVNENGTVLNSKKVAYGTVPTYEGTTPVKAGDAQYTYEFAGWDKEIVAVTGEATYTATFNSILNQYTVIWENEDGTELEKDEGVDYGTTPSYDGAVPTKAATAEYTYTFDKWNPTVSEVTGNVTYTATYSQKANEYTVTYYSDPDKVYETIEVAFGEDFPTVEAPSKEGYTFTGWDKEIPETMPAENVTITAKWEIEKHTLTFQDVDGTVIATINQEFGTNVTKPVNPQKAGYTFVNWDKVVPATMPAEDRVYTAVWDIIPYDVSYELVGGSLEEGKTNPVSYNVETDTFTLNNPTKKGYDFAGWTGTGITGAAQTVTVEEGSIGDRSYTATWTPIEYTISYNLAEGNLDVGKTNPTSYTIETPTFTLKNPTREGYTFLGWVGSNGTTENPNVSVLKGTVGELSYTAKWEINTYTVTYVADGETVTTRTVAHGSDVEDVPAVPTKIGYDKTAPYWNHDGKNITSDTVIEAVYTINKYTVTYVANGETVATKTVEHGADVEEVPDVPAKVGYDKTAPYWNNDGKDIASDTTIEAVYTINEYTVTYVADGQIVDTKTVTHGADVGNVPAVPVKEGYTQNAPKWNHDGKNITSDLTIEAVYTINKYTVTYVANGETVSEQTVEHGSDAEVPGIPVKEGYTQTNPYWSHNGKNIKSDLTIEAVYTINKYTVTYVIDGKTVKTESVEHGKDATAPAIPAKEGYTQAEPVWDKVSTNITADITITAVYTINKYTVTYVADGETVDTQTVEHGKDAVVPAIPTKEGYTQNAPYWNADGKKITSDTTIEAVYTINTYTVTYVTDSGNAIGAVTKTHNETADALADSKTGHTFLGWAEIAGGEVVYEAGDTITFTKSMTLYAKWSVNSYTITYYVDGAQYGSVATVEYNTQIELPAEPTKDGFKFYGWVYKDETSVGMPQRMPAQNLEVAASWIENQYVITFYPNMGDATGTKVQMVDIVANGDTTATLDSNTFQRTGYTFLGWAETADGQVKYENAVEVSLTGDLPLYAVWSVNKYTITFANTGDSTVASITANYGADVDAPADPVKEGYHFVGWSEPIPDTMPAKDMTITANWEINTYTVTYVADGKIVDTQSVEHGADAAAPQIPVKIGYDKTAPYWNNAGKNITADTTITAVYTINTYTVTYKADGKIVDTQSVEHGADAVAPQIPVKTGYTDTAPYWNENGVNITADTVIEAVYTVNKYTVKYVIDGAVVSTQTVEHGANANAPEIPGKTGYDQVTPKWDKVSTNITADMTITAIYTINKYTVKYVVDGEVKDTQTVEHGKAASAPEIPAKTGYDQVAPKWDKISTNITADTTITAVYTVNKYTVKYVIDGETVDTQTVEHGANASAPEIPAKTGYDQVAPKWDKVSTNITADTTITAVYTINTYKVTYMAGDLKVASQNVEHGADAVAPQIPAKDGYTQTAPYWDADGKNITSDTTITAVYTINKYTVKYVVDGEVKDTQTVEHGKAAAAPEIPAKTGYDQVAPEWNHDGKNITSDLTIEAVYTINKYTVKYVVDGEVKDTQTVEHGKAAAAPEIPAKTGYDQVVPEWDKPSTNITADTTITAVYTINKYTVTFHTDSGNTIDAITKTYNETVSAPADSKTGHTFQGWAPVENGTVLYKAGESITFNQDRQLYAIWSVNKYTVNFELENETFESREVAYGEAITAPASEPTKEGHTFGGWYNGNQKVTFPITMPEDGLALTAKWTVNKYFIYFMDGDSTVDSKRLDYGAAIEAPAAPTKEGYTFTGWDPAVPATMPAKDLTVNAQWDANAYTITFNTDGGTAVESATYDFGETVTAPAAPTKEGYTFTGWSPALPKTMPAKDYEVTAQWKINQYTITFDSDGGSAVAAIKQDYNTAVTAPAAPTKTGYTFDGWDAEIPATMPAENLTIKAKWTINEYSITFDANDDGEAETTITKNYGEQVDAPTAPEKEGYTFDGWYSGETKVNFPITMPADGMTLKAHWNVNRYTITFNSNGGTRVNAITDDYGATITAPAAPTKTGYTFTGWLPALPATMPVDGLNVTAQWQINQYTITFDTDGGSDVAAITQDYDTDVTRPANPTKIGYTFGGWVDENGAAVNVPSTMPARNVTLKAKWNINTYTITFNTDGGSAVAPITQQYGTAVTAPAAPTKVGYTFAGWDVEVPTTMPAGNLVITAKWTVNQYTITFDTDGGSEVDAIIQNYGTDVTAPAAPTKTGYTFDGWDAEIPTTMPAGDMTIKAKWKINQYTIVFYTAGGSAVKSITAEFGAPITAPADPTKEGHTFTGWNQEIPATMPATNMNIVASWSINSYTITFADCDVAPITAEFGAEVVAPANPTRIGYTFLGWDKTVPATMPAGDMTITAQWRVDQHTITFADCGLNPINASYGTVIDKPADPARTGYTFLGWDVAIPETMPAKDMTITALWQINQYTITFDTDGGTAIDPITQDYNTAVTEPADPEKIGYTFVGWDKDIPLTMPAEDQTITAKWTINQYTVTFDTDGGSAVESVAKNYGEQIEEPAAPEKEGHSFTGWVDVEGNAVSFPVTVGAQDVTIKAIWKANQYTITFNTDGGNEIASITQDYGTVITAPANPTKEGYSFAGWNVKIPETMPAGDMTITAKWNINRYTITFNTDGGSEITAISRPYGTEIIAPEDPVKEGHTFLGWDQEIPATMPAGDMTITAQWQINQYTISFKGCEHESITADYGTPLNIEDPTREGYSFDGWNDVVPATMPAQDMELTARWVINQYTITFNTAGGDELDPITQDYGTPINFNTSPEREGYTFITWSPELPKTMPAQDMTLTAIWTLDTYTITFDTAGGSAMAPIVQQYGTEIVAPENPTREGYIFDGWDIKIPETMPAENLTITASWKPATFTITFVSDGEEVGSVTAEYGSAIRPVNPPSKTGYDFAGWEPAIPATMPSEDLVVTAKWTPQKYTLYFDANGGEEIPLMTMDYGAKIEVPADPVREGYIFTGWDMEIPETMPAEDLVIVASWKIGSFAITFDTDGGSEVGEIVQNYGTPVRVPEDPTRTGYTFVGWEPEIPETMPGKDMTIKAIWKAKQYTLSFNTEGGSEIEPITADYGSPITAPKAPKKAGYTFVGWDKKIPETMPARNMIFNAIWEEGEEPADLFYISFANMTLGNSLKMNFAFEQGHLEDWTGHYATIRKTYADGRPDVVATIPYEQWGQAGINGKAYYTISFNGIAAKEMADDVFVTVFNADGEAVSYVWEDSVRAYAMRTMNNPNSSEETLIMVVDMLNYGAAAQNYFEYDTEDPANNQLTEEQLALATPSVTFSDSRISDENYLGTLLRLESQILMRLAFNNVTEDMYAVISFTSHSGKSYEVTVQSDEFEFTGAVAAINVDEIVVADGRKPVTVTVYNADGTVHSTVTESMESYIARMSESDVLYELIMKFSDSAYNYFHKDDV